MIKMVKNMVFLHNTLKINQLAQRVDNQLVINILKKIPQIFGNMKNLSYLYYIRKTIKQKEWLAILTIPIMNTNSQFTQQQLDLFSKYEEAGKTVEEINFIKEQVLLCKTNELWVLDEVTNEWYIASKEVNN